MTNDAAEEPETAGAEAPEPAAAEAPESADPADPVETVTAHEEVEVGLVRSVRHGRIILTAVVVFAVLGMIAAMFFPVAEDAEYTLGQVVGYMAVVGAIIGLVLGSLLALLLGLIAKRRRGEARAVQVDVR